MPEKKKRPRRTARHEHFGTGDMVTWKKTNFPAKLKSMRESWGEGPFEVLIARPYDGRPDYPEQLTFRGWNFETSGALFTKLSGDS